MPTTRAFRVTYQDRAGRLRKLVVVETSLAKAEAKVRARSDFLSLEVICEGPSRFREYLGRGRRRRS